MSVTARHYAKWIEDDRYREPMTLEPNEVPADLLARLGGEKSDPTSDPRTQLSVIAEAEEAVQVPALPTESMVTRARFERATPSFGGWSTNRPKYRPLR